MQRLAIRFKKAGRFEKLLGFVRSHFFMTRGLVMWLSHAPPHRTFPAFLNLYGRIVVESK